jgi:hypothetical protein
MCVEEKVNHLNLCIQNRTSLKKKKEPAALSDRGKLSSEMRSYYPRDNSKVTLLLQPQQNLAA